MIGPRVCMIGNSLLDIILEAITRLLFVYISMFVAMRAKRRNRAWHANKHTARWLECRVASPNLTVLLALKCFLFDIGTVRIGVAPRYFARED